jgi:hypothetical protein
MLLQCKQGIVGDYGENRGNKEVFGYKRDLLLSGRVEFFLPLL